MDQIRRLIRGMSLPEKIGQMTQAERKFISSEDITRFSIGSILNGGGSVPGANTPEDWRAMIDEFQHAALSSRQAIPLLYGTDAVHGHNNVRNATLFPHNIGLGATRNPTLIGKIALATAREVASTGVHWNFAPALSVVRDCRWGRSYESFGEQPEIATSMAGEYVRHMQHQHWVMATAKHWVGDGGTTYGTGDNHYHIDRGDTRLDPVSLDEIHITPYKVALSEGVGSVMLSYNRVKGIKMHEHEYLNNQVLKGILAFDGFTVSDWQAISEVSGTNQTERIANAVNAGLDMAMEPEDWRGFIARLNEAVNKGMVSEQRLDDAVYRILRQKKRFRLFDSPLSAHRWPEYQGGIGSLEHRALAKSAVSESQVLLKNQQLLPLNPRSKVFVTGSHADDIGLQCGGWSISWQGCSGNITEGTSILDGIRQHVPTAQFSPFVEDARDCDLAIVVVGEQAYAEGYGDMATDSHTFFQRSSLGPEQTRQIAQLHERNIPICLVLVTGRPLLINDVLPKCAAVLISWLPGSEGDGVADVLFGRHPVKGRLPVSWPETFENYSIVSSPTAHTSLFPCGFGLTI